MENLDILGIEGNITALAEELGFNPEIIQKIEPNENVVTITVDTSIYADKKYLGHRIVNIFQKFTDRLPSGIEYNFVASEKIEAAGSKKVSRELMVSKDSEGNEIRGGDSVKYQDKVWVIDYFRTIRGRGEVSVVAVLKRGDEHSTAFVDEIVKVEPKEIEVPVEVGRGKAENGEDAVELYIPTTKEVERYAPAYSGIRHTRNKKKEQAIKLSREIKGYRKLPLGYELLKWLNKHNNCMDRPGPTSPPISTRKQSYRKLSKITECPNCGSTNIKDLGNGAICPDCGWKQEQKSMQPVPEGTWKTTHELPMVSFFFSSKSKEEIIEALADIVHKEWIEWSKDIEKKEDLSEDRIKRWKEYWKPYKDLPEDVKEEDRKWAKKLYDVFEKAKEASITKLSQTAQTQLKLLNTGVSRLGQQAMESGSVDAGIWYWAAKHLIGQLTKPSSPAPEKLYVR